MHDTVSTLTHTVSEQLHQEYGARDSDADYVYRAPEGVNRQVVQRISAIKGEPAWMRRFRLRSLEIFLAKALPL